MSSCRLAFPSERAFHTGHFKASAVYNLLNRLSKSHNASISWLRVADSPRSLSDWSLHRLYDAGWIMSLQAHDLDEDGDLDVVTCEERDNLGVIWYENPGTGDGK